ncbi:OmpL47-type beta-barrel domain-containing protein [Oerskovia flava]|uniref:OmpL47-type beta-barrel domain-containing protein n=1 Tax=Oerskovia flava TaxID=2986422 RepID=UPI002240AB8F|nr:hypothetical protein [Oerskovia sp. JB1-3-2]
MERPIPRGDVRRHGTRRLMAVVVAGLTAAAVVAATPASAVPVSTGTSTSPATGVSVPADVTVAAEQVLRWTGDNSIDTYPVAPATAVAGPATIVFENSLATGSTFGMSHTLTFDTSTPGYNHDVDLDILASPFDANGGLHEREVVLTPGTYRYFCAIPGHGQMWGELVVTDGGGGEEDTTPPTVTATVTGEQDDDGAYVGGATVTLDASDDDSGVAGVEYDLDGAGWQAYDEPFTVETVGEHTLSYRATDAAGNTSEAGTATFTVVEGGGEEDTTAPTVTAEVSGEQDEDGAYVGSATLSLAAEDEGSGVASIEVDAHGGHWMPYTAPLAFTEPGEHTVSYRATDNAGNVSEVGTTTFTVVADDGEEDTTAPTVTAEVSGDRDDNGDFVGSASVTLTATDDSSGVESVEYDLDGAGWTEYTAPVVVDEVGEHEIVYRATDVAGNVSEETVTTFTVVADGGEDTTAPTVTTEVSGEQDENGAYLGSAAVLINATDDGSGVASVEYDLDGAGWTEYTEAVVIDEPGEHTLSYRATDEAGNVSEVGTVLVTVVATDTGDTVAPEVDYRVYGQLNDDGEYVGTAFVRLHATDDDSGVASVEYQIDGGEWIRYGKQIPLRAPGAHVVTFRATDVAGNVSAPQSVTVVLEGGEDPGDVEGPEVTAGVGGSRNRDGAFVGRATVTLTAVDEESGVDRTEFQVDGGSWQRYAAPFVVAADGQHVVRYRAVDGAGNVSSGEVTFTVVELLRDRCPGSDVRPTVIIDGIDSTVENFDDGEGCTVNDHIAEDDQYPTHREFVRHVREVTRDLVDEGVLIGAERQQIIAAAELSNIGR